ncbi:hypothetical protein [Methylibium sp.]|uniref:hypothetical protein n=1 Tax=Methylibium sp. TaxID=2067992 RepID=UPI0018262265|nr:hypothetical protein [Methylibium sp.]MBA3590137.1 hypothetical protein [Methylibium sp.]
MQAQKPILDAAAVRASLAQGLPARESGDPRERHAAAAARPTVPQPQSERLSGPFRVKPGYLERRAWPFSAQG